MAFTILPSEFLIQGTQPVSWTEPLLDKPRVRPPALIPIVLSFPAQHPALTPKLCLNKALLTCSHSFYIYICSGCSPTAGAAFVFGIEMIWPPNLKVLNTLGPYQRKSLQCMLLPLILFDSQRRLHKAHPDDSQWTSKLRQH